MIQSHGHPRSKGHNVDFIAGPRWLGHSQKSKTTKKLQLHLIRPGIHVSMHTHKSMGMIAPVIVGDDTSNKDAIAKAKAMGKSKRNLKSY